MAIALRCAWRRLCLDSVVLGNGIGRSIRGIWVGQTTYSPIRLGSAVAVHRGCTLAGRGGAAAVRNLFRMSRHDLLRLSRTPAWQSSEFGTGLDVLFAYPRSTGSRCALSAPCGPVGIRSEKCGLNSYSDPRQLDACRYVAAVTSRKKYNRGCGIVSVQYGSGTYQRCQTLCAVYSDRATAVDNHPGRIERASSDNQTLPLC
jgi:hypothetical protein